MRALCTVLFLLASGLGHAVTPGELTSKAYPPLPEGCRDFGGDLDPDTDTPLEQRKVLQWVRCGKQVFAVIAEPVRREQQKVFMRALAVQQVPPIPKGYKIASEGHCSDPTKKNDVFLWAIVRWKDRKGGMLASDIKYAWRADSKGNRFVQLDPKTVKCSFNWS